MKKIYFILPIIIGLLLSFTVMNVAFAANITDQMQGSIDGFDLPHADNPDNTDQKTQQVLGSIINAFLSFLGILFMLLIIYGGYKWMMARGAEEEIKRAKDIIRGAVIGLIITLAAYSIAYFVSNALQGATS